jgi:hypothetical protein
MGPATTSPRGGLRRAWPLLPLAAGILYAVAWPLVRRDPALSDLVPADAIATERFKDLATFDRVKTGSLTAPGTAAPSAVVGASVNLPGLAGIDRHRPLVGALLAPEHRFASTLWILPVAREDVVTKTFSDPDLEERHAGWLEVRGEHALVGVDRAAVRLAAGRGGAWPEERGEDFARAADWPRLVDHAVRNGRDPPYRAILEAIGVDVERALPRAGEPIAEAVSWGRLPRVRDAWTKVSLHGWADRVRVEAVATPDGELARALEAARTAPEEGLPPAPPPFVTGPTLRVFGAAASRALVLALRDAGVRFPETASLDDVTAGAPLSAWADPSGEAWTLVFAGRALPSPATFGLPDAGAGPAAPYESGRAPLTAPSGGGGPAGAVARRTVDGLSVLAIGPEADSSAAKAASALDGAATGETPSPPKGSRVLAEARLPAKEAARLLGEAIGPGGLLLPLAGGDVTVVVSTDGKAVVLDLERR